MPVWTWIVIGVGGAAVVTAAVVVATSAWNRMTRRYVVQVLGKREEARTVRRAFEDIVTALRESDESVRGEFSDDAEALDRHSLAELSDRARQLALETNVMPLPRRLVSAAEALADAADILAEEAGRVGEGTIGDEALEALASIDLAKVDRIFEHAYAQIAAVRDEYHVDETTVYGEGLFIR